MPKFIVDIQRISYSQFIPITVEAKNEKEAVKLGMEAAGDFEFEECNAEYNVDEVREVRS